MTLTRKLLFGMALLMLAFLMPTAESLWIDETATLRFAEAGSLSDLYHRLATSRDSLAQMPLGSLAAWAWLKLRPSTELDLRALNIIWVLLGAWALLLTGRRLSLPALPLWFCVQPFLWFYANEFRPYALQIAASAWLLHGFVGGLQDKGRGSGWAWCVALGGAALAGASLLGVIPLALVLLVLAAAFRSWRVWPSREAAPPLLLGLLLLLPLAFHHGTALARGAGGARVWELSLFNPLFAVYELLGFLGLGPARLEIRETARAGAGPLTALFPGFLPGLAALGLLYALLLLPLRRREPDDRKPVMHALAAVIAGTVLLLLAAAAAAGWPFWGRHLAPLLPFTVCLTAWLAGRAALDLRPARLTRAIPVVLAALLLLSSLTLRFAARHRKDNYRHAVRRASAAATEGKTVWWSADIDTARHYGLVFGTDYPEGDAVYAVSNLQGGLGLLNEPALVFTSKADLFDSRGNLNLWLRQRQYRKADAFPGFTVWSRPYPPFPARFPVLEAGISAVTPAEAADRVLDCIAARERRYLSVCTADTVLQCHDDPALAAVVNGSALAVPDGMPLVWLGRLRGHRVERVYGPDLLLALCDRGRGQGVRHYFYGGTEEILRLLAENLTRRFPGLVVAGSWAPPFRPLTPEEEAEAAHRINEARPDIVWVGIGTPKQDFWCAAFRSRLEAPVLIPVGAAFNFHAGRVRQAPRWMQRAGLEWLFRLLMEPRRLWKRYLVGNLRFTLLVLRQFLSRNR